MDWELYEFQSFVSNLCYCCLKIIQNKGRQDTRVFNFNFKLNHELAHEIYQSVNHGCINSRHECDEWGKQKSNIKWWSWIQGILLWTHDRLSWSGPNDPNMPRSFNNIATATQSKTNKQVEKITGFHKALNLPNYWCRHGMQKWSNTCCFCLIRTRTTQAQATALMTLHISWACWTRGTKETPSVSSSCLPTSSVRYRMSTFTGYFFVLFTFCEKNVKSTFFAFTEVQKHLSIYHFEW